MNALNSSFNISDINELIKITEKRLVDDCFFSYKTRMRFDSTLDDIINILKNDEKETTVKTPVWDLAKRIVLLNKTQIRLKKISNVILGISENPYFVNKIRLQTIPALQGRIKELKKSIEYKGRLPFSVGISRAQSIEAIEEILQLKNKDHIFRVEKEFFHLLGTHLDHNKLEQINIQDYVGSPDTFSLISWKNILRSFVSEGDLSEMRAGLILLEILNKSIPYAMKNDISNLQFYGRENMDQEINYFKDYLQLHQFKGDSTFTYPQFLKKYQLEANFVPRRVVVNDIAWDMIDIVSSLKQGNSILFPLGLKNHSISVEVICIQDSLIPSEKRFDYKIFNTGYGVESYHKLNGEYAHPLIYKNLPLSAFSYSFFSDLLNIYFQKLSIIEFYELHDSFLIKEGGGMKDSVGGSLYRLQKYDTCSYSAVEAWIHSYLSEQQIKHLDVVKAQISLDKQIEVIKILDRNSRNNVNSWKNTGKKLNRHAIQMQSKKIKENKVLLELGQQYFHHASNKFTNSN